MYAPRLKNEKGYTSDEKKRVLTKAIMRLAERLELSRQELSAIIGLSESSLSRLFNRKDYFLDPTSKEGQLAILLLRLFRSLDTLFGGNAKQCRTWLRSENKHLNRQPIELLQSIEGLIIAIQYLDAMSG